jgi:NTP pyrophosphatase (non-canonical NTP hydrolase)
MDTNEPLPNPSPWIPMKEPIDLKHLGKFAEELAECSAAVSRCIIQGIDEREPITGKLNRAWLEEEIADVLANMKLVVTHFKLDEAAILMREHKKKSHLKQWHGMLA